MPIRDVYPGSRIRIFSIPDSVSKRFRTPDPDPHQKIYLFLGQKIVSTVRKYDLGCSSRIRIPDLILIFYPSRIPDQGSKRHRSQDPDSQHCSCISLSMSVTPVYVTTVVTMLCEYDLLFFHLDPAFRIIPVSDTCLY